MGTGGADGLLGCFGCRDVGWKVVGRSTPLVQRACIKMTISYIKGVSQQGAWDAEFEAN